MDNESIIKVICKREDINLDQYCPITEEGKKSDEEFDLRFSLDRTYQYSFGLFHKRIRFVHYTNNDYITVIKSNLKVSNIIINKFNVPETYFKGNSFNIPIKDIERIFKLKDIMIKMKK